MAKDGGQDEKEDDEVTNVTTNGKLAREQRTAKESISETEEEEEEEPRLKYASLTSHLKPVYRNGDATSTFLVAGDKMVRLIKEIVRPTLTSSTDHRYSQWLHRKSHRSYGMLRLTVGLARLLRSSIPAHSSVPCPSSFHLLPFNISLPTTPCGYQVGGSTDTNTEGQSGSTDFKRFERVCL